MLGDEGGCCTVFERGNLLALMIFCFHGEVEWHFPIPAFLVKDQSLALSLSLNCAAVSWLSHFYSPFIVFQKKKSIGNKSWF